jgi:hypothetical protein
LSIISVPDGECLAGPITKDFYGWFRQIQLDRSGDRSLIIRSNTRFWVNEETFGGNELSLRKLILCNCSLKGSCRNLQFAVQMSCYHIGELSRTVFSSLLHVVMLDLSWNVLQGNLRFVMSWLGKRCPMLGQFPASILDLKYLKVLNLCHNQFTGALRLIQLSVSHQSDARFRILWPNRPPPTRNWRASATSNNER